MSGNQMVPVTEGQLTECWLYLLLPVLEWYFTRPLCLVESHTLDAAERRERSLYIKKQLCLYRKWSRLAKVGFQIGQIIRNPDKMAAILSKPFEIWTIWQPTCFGPFEIRTHPDFESPLYVTIRTSTWCWIIGARNVCSASCKRIHRSSGLKRIRTTVRMIKMGLQIMFY